METDINAVMGRLAGQIGDLSIRLAIAEARLAAFERAEIDRMAAQEEAANEDR
jgi:hypothetical protein